MSEGYVLAWVILGMFGFLVWFAVTPFNVSAERLTTTFLIAFLIASYIVFVHFVFI